MGFLMSCATMKYLPKSLDSNVGCFDIKLEVCWSCMDVPAITLFDIDFDVWLLKGTSDLAGTKSNNAVI